MVMSFFTSWEYVSNTSTEGMDIMSMPFVSNLANSLKKKIHVIQIRFTPKFQYWKSSLITLKLDTFLVGGDLIAVLLKAWYLRRLCRPNVMPRDPFPETQAFCSNVEAAILIFFHQQAWGVVRGRVIRLDPSGPPGRKAEHGNPHEGSHRCFLLPEKTSQ